MADEDPAHLARVRRMTCAVCESMPPNHPHHSTSGGQNECKGCGVVHAATEKQQHLKRAPRGKGTRAHDHETLPLCWKHHRQFHDATGHFAGWSREQRHEWQSAQVAATQGLLMDESVF